jgi:hypothetical protein
LYITSEVVLDFLFDLALDHLLTEISPKLEGALRDPEIKVLGKIQHNIQHLKPNFILNQETEIGKRMNDDILVHIQIL